MKRRLVYPDVLRAAACVATVLFSTCIAAGYTPAIGLLTWVCPMFLMLSGMFFLDGSWYLSGKELGKRYVLRLVVAYLVWGMFAMLVNALTGNVLQGILTGSSCYLNFLFVLFILYAFSPVLRVFTRAAQPRELAYLVVFGVLLGGVYPFVQSQIGSVRVADYALMGFGYLGVFAAGWYLRTAFLTRKQLRIFYLLGAVCVIILNRSGTADAVSGCTAHCDSNFLGDQEYTGKKTPVCQDYASDCPSGAAQLWHLSHPSDFAGGFVLGSQ